MTLTITLDLRRWSRFMFLTRCQSRREFSMKKADKTSRTIRNINRSSCRYGDDRERHLFRLSILRCFYCYCFMALMSLDFPLVAGSTRGLELVPRRKSARNHAAWSDHPQGDSTTRTNRRIRDVAIWKLSKRPSTASPRTISPILGDSQRLAMTGSLHIEPPIVNGGVVEMIRDLKMALAGAFAGAVATAFLFPIDTAKTLRQANPKAIRGTREALAHVWRTRGPLAIYTGLPTAVFGAMPSSALYFGTYEAVKSRLLSIAARVCVVSEGGDLTENGGEGLHPVARAGAHALAAACGNAASSLLFVPKEYVKQKIQASGMAAAGSSRATAAQIIRSTLQEKGVRGLYCGYWATLSRNIPSAVIRFSLYEEIKLLVGPERLLSAPPIYLLAGAIAGACASGLTTPFDVLKTRVATGSLDGNRGFVRNMAYIVGESGWKGLYVGFQPRVVMSGLFTAIGFGSFETFKTIFGVSSTSPASEWQHGRRNASVLETPSGTSRPPRAQESVA